MKLDPIISIIVAVSENGVIGRDGDMPWKLSSDLKRFKTLTIGHPVIMGRKTFDSIGKPLPGRLNIVVTRDMAWEAEGALRVASLQSAIDLAAANLESIHAHNEDADAVDDLPREIFIIGGGQIYAQAFGFADVLYVTHVLADIEGDTTFPPISADYWETEHSEDIAADERNSHATRYAIYARH